MHKALRIVTEELQSAGAPALSWHPMYASGSNVPPCYPELMNLMVCVCDKKPAECSDHYRALIDCLHVHGLGGAQR